MPSIRLRVLLVFAACAAWTWHASGRCSAQELLNKPAADEPAAPASSPLVPTPASAPGDWMGTQPTSTGDEIYPPEFGENWSPVPIDPYTAADPLMEPPRRSRIRFISGDAAIVKPHFNRGFSTGNNAEQTANPPINLPFASLATTVMPRLEMGITTDGGAGEYRLAYQFVHSQASEPLAGFDELGGGSLKSLLDAHLADLDYVFNETAIGVIGDYPTSMVPKFRWSTGARFSAVYFESEAQGKAILNMGASQKFFGAGPRLGLELIWPAYIPSLTAFARANGSLVIGSSKQEFVRTVAPGAAEPDTYGLSHEVNAVPMVNAQFGLRWVPENCNQRIRFTAGYQYERWISFGTRTVTNIDVILAGFFGRVEWAF